MNPTPMQLFSQKKILLAIYPGLSIEEIDAKEIKHFGCMINIDYQDQYIGEGGQECYGGTENKTLYMGLKGYTVDDDFDLPDTITSGYDDDFESNISIIGLPPTLPRVLEALGYNYYYNVNRIYYTNSNKGGTDMICIRKLLNSNKTDATLRDQTPETQLAIAKLIGREE